jgi:hypothetical protein
MGQVNQPSDVNSEIRELKRQVQELTKRVGLSSAVISRGGLRIINAGELVLEDEDGVQVFKIGQINFGSGTSMGMRLNYDNGEPAMLLGGSPGDQAWAMFDENGHYVFTCDAETGFGLGRPYLNYRMVPSSAAESVGEGTGSHWPSTTSGSEVKLMQGVNPVWHPRVSVGVSALTIGGGAAQWRLEIGGSTAASGSGPGVQNVAVPGWGTTILPGDSAGFDLYANISGGATRIWVQCDRLYGLQS